MIKRLDSSTKGAAGTYQEKIIVLPGLAILAFPRIYALCLGTGGTALFTALLTSYAEVECEHARGLGQEPPSDQTLKMDPFNTF
ncbi:hypothetical protein EVAR_43914_1 [Eumeta japonica]|uniref:Uncharacterized protein n=1 Tax=Eumeta variegata TaxID=151549 RepID=A0A4C1WNZ9_EUMVA|nr:hypothetical protein EVAR_43914_1 [Eumeta japonica]